MSFFRNRNTSGVIPNLSRLRVKKIVTGNWSLVGTGGATTIDITISEAVNPERAVLLLQLVGGGTTTQDRNNFNYYLFNSTTIRLTRQSALNTYAYATYSIIEFEEGIKIQNGSMAITGATATATINPVNLRKAFVIYGGMSLNSSDMQQYDVRTYLSNSTTVTAERNSTSSPTSDVRFQVVEIT